MADKTIGSVLYATDGSRLDYDTAANLDANFRDVSAQADAAMIEARRPQYADNGDGTITLTESATITDAGDGTLTIGV